MAHVLSTLFLAQSQCCNYSIRFTNIYLAQEYEASTEMGIGLRWFKGTPTNLLECQSFALMVVFSARSDTQRVVRETTRCSDSRPTEGTWKCAEDGRVWMVITAHQGEFQRVTKFLKVLHMKDLQFFLLVSSLKSKGVEAKVLCAHSRTLIITLLKNKQ